MLTYETASLSLSFRLSRRTLLPVLRRQRLGRQPAAEEKRSIEPTEVERGDTHTHRGVRERGDRDKAGWRAPVLSAGCT